MTKAPQEFKKDYENAARICEEAQDYMGPSHPLRDRDEKDIEYCKVVKEIAILQEDSAMVKTSSSKRRLAVEIRKLEDVRIMFKR